MKASERVRKGFRRIAAMGGIAAIAIAALIVGAWIYKVAIKDSADVYFDGRYVAVRKYATEPDLIRLLQQEGEKWDHFDRLMNESARPPIEVRAGMLKVLAERHFETDTEPTLLYIAIGAGVAWVGLWLLASWLIRGFLE